MPQTALPLSRKNNPQRTYVIGGLLLIIAGMIFGELFAIFVIHPLYDKVGSLMYAAAQAVTAADPDAAQQAFRGIGEQLESRGTKVDSHNHVIQLGMLALLLSFLQPYVRLSQQTKQRLAMCFIGASVLLPVSVFLIHYVGLAYSPFSHIGWASVSADLAGGVLVLVLMAQLMGVIRYFHGGGKTAEAGYCECPESRLLLRVGLFMLLAGMLYGAFFAAKHYDAMARQELSLLTTIVDSAANGEQAKVDRTFGDYGYLQTSRGTKVAAHAHLNEIAMVMLLVAFAQPLVFLQQAWKRRWAKLMALGGVMLPVAIYSELWLPVIVGGGLADLSGGLVLLGLIAMLFGILRTTGIVDAREEESV